MLSEWIQLAEVVASTARTIVRLDESFFRARFDRLTNSEKRYLARWPSSVRVRIAPARSRRGKAPS